MISIRSELDRNIELKKAEEFRSQVAKEYALAIRTVADYAIELDPALTASFRRHLRRLQAKAETSESSVEFAEFNSALRGELRWYRDQSEERVLRMRADLSAAETAMQSMAQNMTASGADLEVQVKEEISRLETAAADEDLGKIREAIQWSVSALRTSYEELQRSNHMVVAQMQEEIRLLHKGLAEERRTMYTDPASGAWVRAKLDTRIEQLLSQGAQFWILFARFEARSGPYPKIVMDGALQALVRRITGILGPNCMVGRWAPDVFAGIMETGPAVQSSICQVVRDGLPGVYPIWDDGTTHQVDIRVEIAAVTHRSRKSAADFYLEVGQTLGALGAR